MISLILPSYKRPELLNLGLWSISKQNFLKKFELEIIVLNESRDKETEGVCKYYSSKFNIRHIFSNPKNEIRNVVFSSNIGIKQAKGEIIILSCPEMFHLNNTFELIINPLLNDKKIISVPNYIFFDTGEIKKYLYMHLTLDIPKQLLNNLTLNNHNKYSATLPFFMALYKQELLDIGGYNQNLIGIAGEDDDLVKRLIVNGLKYYHSDISIIHLFHPKSFDETTKETNTKYLYNKQILQEDKEIIVNKDIEWGKLDE